MQVMSMRLRTVNGIRVALCAVESDSMPGDVYLDDGDQHALTVKFVRDVQEMAAGSDARILELMSIVYAEEWAAMDSQKLRDAVEELNKWAAQFRCKHCGHPYTDSRHVWGHDFEAAEVSS